MRSIWMVLVPLVSLFGCGSDGADGDSEPGKSSEPVTYWQDVMPILEDHCLQCHQEGGIGPVHLDDYAEAHSRAALIKVHTKERTMPPWAVTSDGSCGNFADSLALTDEQIATFAAWVDGGAQEGTPRSVQRPKLPALESTTELRTPEFAPEIQGGVLAEFDEYRCFLADENAAARGFITGYEVLPGAPEVVHHVLGFIVDPAAPSEVAGKTNAQQMQALDAESPDRDGWPCFGAAGEGVEVNAAPIAWAPGQGVVEYPNQSGVPLEPTHRIVLQVHYNLADSAQQGRSDQTTIKLRLSDDVPNIGLFTLPDPFLDSLENETPDVLEPGRASVKYTWKQSFAELGLDGLPGAQLYGVMPHMHEAGRKYSLRVQNARTGSECAADVQDWDFHWQRMYFYARPFELTPQSSVEVTCDFDTSGHIEPVLPGWGTRNEMCLAVLYFVIPR